jgi:hypothetical protein
MIRGDEDVTGKREFESSGDRHAVHGTDHRLAAGLDRTHGVRARIRVGSHREPRRTGTELFQIESGSECFFTCPGQHDHPYGGILPQRCHCIVEGAPQRFRERIHGVRAVQRHDGNAARRVFGQYLGRHGWQLGSD